MSSFCYFTHLSQVVANITILTASQRCWWSLEVERLMESPLEHFSTTSHIYPHTYHLCTLHNCVCLFPPSGMALGVAMVCLLCMSLCLHGWVNGYWQHHLWPLTLFAVLINSAELKQGYTFPAVLFIVVTKATGTLVQSPHDPQLCPQHAKQLTSMPLHP